MTWTEEGIHLTGFCGVEEAETLLALIQNHPDAAIDLSQAGTVHTALWQVVMAMRPAIAGEPRDPFIRDWIVPHLLAPK